MPHPPSPHWHQTLLQWKIPRKIKPPPASHSLAFLSKLFPSLGSSAGGWTSGSARGITATGSNTQVMGVGARAECPTSSCILRLGLGQSQEAFCTPLMHCSRVIPIALSSYLSYTSLYLPSSSFCPSLSLLLYSWFLESPPKYTTSIQGHVSGSASGEPIERREVGDAQPQQIRPPLPQVLTLLAT